MDPIMTTTATVPIPADLDDRGDRDFDGFRARVQARFLANLAEGGGVLFATDADENKAASLFDAYLDALPPADRQYHTCTACRRFFETYGSLVTIDAAGQTRSALWHADDVPPYYADAIEAVARRVHRARVTGVFLSADPVWGTPENVSAKTGARWTHFAVTPPASALHRHALLTAGQSMAEVREDRGAVGRALAEFPAEVVGRAVAFLESESLYRAEKVVGPARWLRDLHAARESVRDARARDNLIWKAVATAPPGFAHPRSSMVGTLLEDIAAGLPFAEASRKFAAKMHPLAYQRPTAAPSAGNIAEAEKVVEKLGIARSLLRRFARLDEVVALWRPRPPKAPQGVGGGAGVFGHLTPKGAGGSSITGPDLPAATMTWVKFRDTVLPTAEAIEFYVPPGRANFAALLTAVDPAAPPIHQWDRADRRNPFSSYVYHEGSPASQWGLFPGTWRKVTALTTRPAHWAADPGEHSHHGESILFLLDGARDTRASGLALFPETLKSELHGIRATIEAYSARGTIEGRDEASACGILFGKGGSWDGRFRVTAGGVRREYRLDRWD
jgi:hypothetical protein